MKKLLILTNSHTPSNNELNIWKGRGYSPIHIPLLLANYYNKPLDLSEYYGIVITSRHAMPALNFIKENLPIYTISRKMAEYIAYTGKQNRFYYHKHGEDAQSLKHCFKQHPPKGSLAYLCGKRIRTHLNFLGVLINAITVYEMQVNDAAKKELEGIDWNHAAVHVSSEQALETLNMFRIIPTQIFCKSPYLKNYGQKFFDFKILQDASACQ